MFSTLGFVECHLPEKLLTRISQSRWGHTSARRLQSPLWSGEAASPFHPENGKEQSTSGLSPFGFPPPRGELGSLQQELLVCSCPSITHPPCSPCPSCGVCEAL